MPRYYFNLVHTERSVEDLEGIELPGDSAAREEASILAQSISNGRPTEDTDWTGWSVAIFNETGASVDVVPIVSTA